MIVTEPHQGLPDRSAEPLVETSRRTMITGVSAAALFAPAVAGWATQAQAQAAASAEDEAFMKLALDEARQGDYPFGTVITKDGVLWASGHNSGRTEQDPTAHGEMVAIRNFLTKHSAADLAGTTLYTTGEPCAMCMGAILWSGISRLVFAASVDQMATKIDQIMISSAALAEVAKFAPISITGGVLADEAMALFE